MKNFLLVLALCLLPWHVFAQFKLSGTIAEKANQQPVAGATVVLTELNRGTTTNELGYFSFDDLPAGEYNLRVSFLGFTPLVKSVNLSENVNLNLQLQKSELQIGEVVVEATRASEKTATTFTNVSREEIEERNFGQDLPYLLQQTPSVVVNSDAGAGVGYTGIRIRG
ncbi:MAG: TonB-dependent receptor, partial [Hymenobacteraceae bacterium]|nr:TonB-dependent receptor [Hymenobacteraceae bacterium]